MFVLTRLKYPGQDYTVVEKVLAVSQVPAFLITHATGSINDWYYDNDKDGWWYGNEYMPDYRIERILELK